MTNINEELFKQPNTEFTQHLNIPFNERIIFSARFGMGKTTFLKWYFDQSTTKEKYNTIHLFPVNYSVATNEDIFKYIKYDVIVELLRNGYGVKEEDVKLSEVFEQFFKKNYEKITASIIHMIPLLGKEVIDSYDRIRPLIDTFFDIQEKIKLEKNEGDRLIKYLECLESSEGNIFEDDIITKIIEAVLNRAKGGDSKQKKENILIIDDLDRIDPEHIFRLLNIFAAHFDRSNITKNKFGFDKVIFVCDINNIREIFKHKYGLNVDFNGYINKFYSNTVYSFNHAEYYSTFILNQFGEIVLNEKDQQIYLRSFVNDFKSIIIGMLELFTSYRVFDLRNIIKWKNSSNLLFKRSFKLNNVQAYFYDRSSIIAIKFICETLGDVNSLYSAIHDLRKEKLFDNNSIFLRNRLCADLVLLLNTGLKWEKSGTIRYEVNNRKLDFIYRDTSNGYILEEIVPVNTGYTSEDTTDNDLIELLHKAVKLLHTSGFL